MHGVRSPREQPAGPDQVPGLPRPRHPRRQVHLLPDHLRPQLHALCLRAHPHRPQARERPPLQQDLHPRLRPHRRPQARIRLLLFLDAAAAGEAAVPALPAAHPRGHRPEPVPCETGRFRERELGRKALHGQHPDAAVPVPRDHPGEPLGPDCRHVVDGVHGVRVIDRRLSVSTEKQRLVHQGGRPPCADHRAARGDPPRDRGNGSILVQVLHPRRAAGQYQPGRDAPPGPEGDAGREVQIRGNRR